MTRTALIIGATGQTGAYLAKRLLEHDYRVFGTSRTSSHDALWRLQHLDVVDQMGVTTVDPMNQESLRKAITESEPDEIYYLAGPSSVAASFHDPAGFFQGITHPIISVLDFLAHENYQGSFFNASSTDCFGNQPGEDLTELSALRPVSPYGVAKTAALNFVVHYRDGLGVRASNGILSNHDSPLRGVGFVTQKVISSLKRIAAGEEEHLTLGNISIRRDWVWAEEVAEAVHLIGSAPGAGDYVVATGHTRSLEDFVRIACEELGLDIASVVTSDSSLHRPVDIAGLQLNPTKIKTNLGWSATKQLEDIVAALVAYPAPNAPS
jgi:GDPmannose 4,6-dehydratase